MPVSLGTTTNFPQGFAYGLSVRGMPLMQMQPGQVFFVNNSQVLSPGQKAGSDGNRGTFLDPFATLNYAINTACVQGRGDIVFVGPGHKETISSATALIGGCAGVAVIGLGAGALKPQLTFDTATSATIPMRASSMSWQNITFSANFADIVTFMKSAAASVTATVAAGTAPSSVAGVGGVMTVSAVGSGTLYAGASVSGTGVPAGTIILSQLTGTAGSTGTYQLNTSFTFASGTITTGPRALALDNCSFRDTSSVLNALSVLSDSGVANDLNGLSVTRCEFTSLGTTAATTAIIFSAAQSTVTLTDNIGSWAALNDTAAFLATGANSVTNFYLMRNVLGRPSTSTTGGLILSTSGAAWTGQCNDNRFYGLDNSAQIWIATGTGLGFNQNYCMVTAAADKSGLINPAAV